MTEKKRRAKIARIYRSIGLDWASSHRAAKRGYLTDFSKCIILRKERVWCYSCEQYHCYITVVDKHGQSHSFCDGVLTEATLGCCGSS